VTDRRARDIPPGRHLRVTRHSDSNPYRFPEEPGHRGRAARHRAPRDGMAGRGDETQCSRSVFTGRGPGASARGMRPRRPTRGTPMWSGPRRSPVPVIAPSHEQSGSHVPPGPPRRRA